MMFSQQIKQQAKHNPYTDEYLEKVAYFNEKFSKKDL